MLEPDQLKMQMNLTGVFNLRDREETYEAWKEQTGETLEKPWEITIRWGMLCIKPKRPKMIVSPSSVPNEEKKKHENEKLHAEECKWHRI